MLTVTPPTLGYDSRPTMTLLSPTVEYRGAHTTDYHDKASVLHTLSQHMHNGNFSHNSVFLLPSPPPPNADSRYKNIIILFQNFFALSVLVIRPSIGNQE